MAPSWEPPGQDDRPRYFCLFKFFSPLLFLDFTPLPSPLALGFQATTKEVKESLGKQWSQLSDKKRLKWIHKALEQRKEYEVGSSLTRSPPHSPLRSLQAAGSRPVSPSSQCGGSGRSMQVPSESEPCLLQLCLGRENDPKGDGQGDGWLLFPPPPAPSQAGTGAPLLTALHPSQEIMRDYIQKHPELNISEEGITRSTLTKAERQLKDKFDGRPTKPPP